MDTAVTATEVRKIRFAVCEDHKWATEWAVEVIEWSDGVFSLYAEREGDIRGMFYEYDGIEFDHAPTAEEVLSELESRFEADAEAASEAWYARRYFG